MKYLLLCCFLLGLLLVGPSTYAAPVALESSSVAVQETQQSTWGNRLVEKLAKRKMSKWVRKIKTDQSQKKLNNPYGLSSIGLVLLFTILIVALGFFPLVIGLLLLGGAFTLGILGLRKDNRRVWSILGIIFSGLYLLLILFGLVFAISVLLAF